MKIPLVLYIVHLHKDDGAMERKWGNFIIYALLLIVEIGTNLS